MYIFGIFWYEQISSTHSEDIFCQCCFDRAFFFTTILLGFRPKFLRLPQFSTVSNNLCMRSNSKISDCRKFYWKFTAQNRPGLPWPQFTNRPGLTHDRPGTNIHPTGLFCSASYVTWTPCTPLVSFRIVTGTPPSWKDSLQRIHTLANFPCGRFLLLTTSPSPNFNHGCADLARKKHFASDKNRPGLALDRSGFHHAGLQGPIGISAYPTGHIFCFFLTSLFEGNK